LKPLREVLERVVELAQLVERYELETSEVNLKSKSKELTECKRKFQWLARSYLVSDDPSLAVDAHKLLNEVDNVTNRGQRRIRRLLRRLGVLPKGSEASSLENKDVRPRGPPQQAEAPGGDSFFRWRSGEDHGG
jgi:site-specific recombinase XerD